MRSLSMLWLYEMFWSKNLASCQLHQAQNYHYAFILQEGDFLDLPSWPSDVAKWVLDWRFTSPSSAIISVTTHNPSQSFKQHPVIKTTWQAFKALAKLTMHKISYLGHNPTIKRNCLYSGGQSSGWGPLICEKWLIISDNKIIEVLILLNWSQPLTFLLFQ